MSGYAIRDLEYALSHYKKKDAGPFDKCDLTRGGFFICARPPSELIPSSMFVCGWHPNISRAAFVIAAAETDAASAEMNFMGICILWRGGDFHWSPLMERARWYSNNSATWFIPNIYYLAHNDSLRTESWCCNMKMSCKAPLKFVGISAEGDSCWCLKWKLVSESVRKL